MGINLRLQVPVLLNSPNITVSLLTEIDSGQNCWCQNCQETWERVPKTCFPGRNGRNLQSDVHRQDPKRDDVPFHWRWNSPSFLLNELTLRFGTIDFLFNSRTMPTSEKDELQEALFGVFLGALIILVILLPRCCFRVSEKDYKKFMEEHGEKYKEFMASKHKKTEWVSKITLKTSKGTFKWKGILWETFKRDFLSFWVGKWLKRKTWHDWVVEAWVILFILKNPWCLQLLACVSWRWSHWLNHFLFRYSFPIDFDSIPFGHGRLLSKTCVSFWSCPHFQLLRNRAIGNSAQREKPKSPFACLSPTPCSQKSSLISKKSLEHVRPTLPFGNISMASSDVFALEDFHLVLDVVSVALNHQKGEGVSLVLSFRGKLSRVFTNLQWLLFNDSWSPCLNWSSESSNWCFWFCF